MIFRGTATAICGHIQSIAFFKQGRWMPPSAIFIAKLVFLDEIREKIFILNKMTDYCPKNAISYEKTCNSSLIPSELPS